MALEDATAQFTVKLKDDTSDGAKKATSALARLQSQMKGEETTVKELRKQMQLLKSVNQQGGQAYRDLEAKLKTTGEALDKHKKKFLDMGGVVTKNYAATRNAGKGADTLANALKALPGPAGQMVRTAERLSSVFGGLSIKTIAMAAGAAALVAGVGLATAALTKYALAVGDARRNEALQLEGMTKIRNYYGLAADSAGFLQTTIDDVSASSALGRDQVAAYAKQLYGMGLRAGNLQQALQGVATVASTQGDERAGMFASMAAGAAATGKSVKALADDVKARLGGIAAKQMLSLDVQAMKLRESFSYLFSGIGIEKFLSGLNEVYKMFSVSTATGRALKVLIETMIQPLIDGAASAGGVMRRLFQMMVIGVLQVTVWFLKLRNTIRDALAGTVVGKAMAQFSVGMDGATVAMKGGIVVAGALAVAMGALAIQTLIAFGPMLLQAALLGAVFFVAYKATMFVLENMGAAWDWFKGKMIGIYDWFANMKWGELGSNIVQGIVNGIKAGAQWVWDAMKNLGNGAVNSFKETLGIHSPSRVFAEQGRFVAAGAAQGIDEGAPSVQAAADRMAPVPSGKALGGGNTSTIQVGDIIINTAATDAKGIAEELETHLARLLEGVALQMGAPAGGTL